MIRKHNTNSNSGHTAEALSGLPSKVSLTSALAPKEQPLLTAARCSLDTAVANPHLSSTTSPAVRHWLCMVFFVLGAALLISVLH